MPEESWLGPKAVRLQQKKPTALNTSRGSTSDRNDHIRMLLLSKSSPTMPDQFSISFCSRPVCIWPLPLSSMLLLLSETLPPEHTALSTCSGSTTKCFFFPNCKRASRWLFPLPLLRLRNAALEISSWSWDRDAECTLECSRKKV